MAAAIKLMRIGKKDYPVYRIVIQDKRQKRNGGYIEKIGFYNPNVKPALVNIDQKKLEDWLSKGAVVSPGVRKLFSKKINKLTS